MYNSYFEFREKPFNVTPDPRYFYTNPIYQEAYASLLYGIRERKGFIVMTGEVGTGKTTLLRKLMNNPEENIRLVFFYNTTLSFEELVTFACDELGLPVKGSGRLQKIQALNEFLVEQSKRGGTVVLLVDEAQNLTDDVLENLRLLSNLETANEKLLQIVLVGQTELEAKLSQPQLRQIKQRVALQCRLDRLKDREIGPFINYRLRVAGYEREGLFTPDAIREIAVQSRGIPRLINIICDNALLIAYATTAKKITIEIIKEVANDLRLDSEGLVVGADPSTAKTLPRSGRKETRANVGVGELASPTRNRTTIFVGTLTVSILVLLVGGAVFYQSQDDTWLSKLVFSRFGLVSPRPIVSQQITNAGSDASLSAKVSREETQPVAVKQIEVSSTPSATWKEAQPDLPTVPIPHQIAESSAKSLPAQKEQSVIIPWGSTISRIASEYYGSDKVLLAMDILKEFNPRIKDLNWVLAGQNISVPPLKRETLLRKQSDDTYYLVLDSFFNAQEAAKLGKAVRAKGYEAAITARKVSDSLVLHRVEIRGLSNLDAASQAWEVAMANRWVSSGGVSSSKENR